MSDFMSPLPRKSVSFVGWNAGGREVFRRDDEARRRCSIEKYPRSGSSLVARPQGRLLDLHEELDVVARLLELVEQQLERLLRLQRTEDPAQLDDDGQLVGRHEDLLLARARRVDVDGREDPLVRQPAVELDLRVTGALELLED